MLRSPQAQATIAKLTLSNTEQPSDIPLGNGYYMIGRHPECQIRPHSNSIAQRHCLLEHQSGLLRVFDLESESGTFVNDERQQPHSWKFLSDGDELRCGKLVFDVTINKPVAPKAPPASPVNSGSTAAAGENESSTSEASVTQSSGQANQHDVTIEEDLDSLFGDDADAFGEPVNEAAFEPTVSEPAAEQPVEPTEPERESDVASEKKPAKTPVKPVKRVEIPKAKPVKMPRMSSGRSLSLPSIDIGDAGGLKLVGVVVVTLAILGFFGYQVYQFSSPPTARIIQEDY